VSPWAELEFTSQGHRWLVWRSPEHEAAKQAALDATDHGSDVRVGTIAYV